MQSINNFKAPQMTHEERELWKKKRANRIDQVFQQQLPSELQEVKEVAM